jgi:uncharacterized membrane protein
MTTARTAPSDKALRRFRMVALWCPVALMVIIAAIQASIIPDLTATVATHFTGDGTADGWGPAWSYPVMTLGVGGGCSVPTNVPCGPGDAAWQGLVCGSTSWRSS